MKYENMLKKDLIRENKEKDKELQRFSHQKSTLHAKDKQISDLKKELENKGKEVKDNVKNTIQRQQKELENLKKNSVSREKFENLYEIYLDMLNTLRSSMEVQKNMLTGVESNLNLTKRNVQNIDEDFKKVIEKFQEYFKSKEKGD